MSVCVYIIPKKCCIYLKKGRFLGGHYEEEDNFIRSNTKKVVVKAKKVL